MMLPMSHLAPERVEPGFRAFVARAFGDEGRAWIASLPETEAALAARWELELGPELPGGLLSCVRAARLRAGTSAVLKLGASRPRTQHEIAALRAWSGVGAPALLEADEELGAMLLERIAPGTHPTAAEPAQIAALLDAIHIAPLEGLPSLAETVQRRVGRAVEEGRASRTKATWATAKAAELESEPHRIALLHGDFDERNLLVCSRRGLCAIDPLPCVGDPAYDLGYWVHGNRRPGRRARLDALVALGFDRGRVRDWAAVVGVHG
jgi:streptomycin 6-kinase